MKKASIDKLIDALEKNLTLKDLLVDQDSASDEQLDGIDELLERNANAAKNNKNNNNNLKEEEEEKQKKIKQEEELLKQKKIKRIRRRK